MLVEYDDPRKQHQGDVWKYDDDDLLSTENMMVMLKHAEEVHGLRNFMKSWEGACKLITWNLINNTGTNSGFDWGCAGTRLQQEPDLRVD